MAECLGRRQQQAEAGKDSEVKASRWQRAKAGGDSKPRQTKTARLRQAGGSKPRHAATASRGGQRQQGQGRQVAASQDRRQLQAEAGKDSKVKAGRWQQASTPNACGNSGQSRRQNGQGLWVWPRPCHMLTRPWLSGCWGGVLRGGSASCSKRTPRMRVCKRVGMHLLVCVCLLLHLCVCAYSCVCVRLHVWVGTWVRGWVCPTAWHVHACADVCACADGWTRPCKRSSHLACCAIWQYHCAVGVGEVVLAYDEALPPRSRPNGQGEEQAQQACLHKDSVSLTHVLLSMLAGTRSASPLSASLYWWVALSGTRRASEPRQGAAGSLQRWYKRPGTATGRWAF